MKKLKSIEAERFISAVQVLIDREIARSFSEIAKKTGNSSQDFTDLKSGKKDLQRKFLDSVCSFYPISKTFVLTGTGDPVESKIKPAEFSPAKQVFAAAGEIPEGSIPLYDIDIDAGTVARVIDDANNIPIIGWLYLKDTPNTTGLLGVRARGDSMATFIHGGDMMLIRKLKNFDFIPPGQAYVVISEELAVVKYIRNGSTPDSWILRSHNDIYEDFEVKRSDVKHLFIVVKVLKDLTY